MEKARSGEETTTDVVPHEHRSLAVPFQIVVGMRIGM
jgi:hypothetical protein